eukprot:m.939693 g.939693  ORF g.939693 m.939693 type:complete len:316 (+) comp23824_c0_seq8:374-1321(+)
MLMVPQGDRLVEAPPVQFTLRHERGRGNDRAKPVRVHKPQPQERSRARDLADFLDGAKHLHPRVADAATDAFHVGRQRRAWSWCHSSHRVERQHSYPDRRQEAEPRVRHGRSARPRRQQRDLDHDGDNRRNHAAAKAVGKPQRTHVGCLPFQHIHRRRRAVHVRGVCHERQRSVVEDICSAERDVGGAVEDGAEPPQRRNEDKRTEREGGDGGCNLEAAQALSPVVGARSGGDVHENLQNDGQGVDGAGVRGWVHREHAHVHRRHTRFVTRGVQTLRLDVLGQPCRHRHPAPRKSPSLCKVTGMFTWYYSLTHTI